MEESFEQVAFAARYRDWMVVKKLMIDANTKPEEVALILASVDKTLVRKSYEYAGINTDIIEAYVAAVAKKGHTYANLSDVFKTLQPGEVKAALLPACGLPEQLPIAESYFVKRLLEEAGYSPVLEPEVLAKVYPHLKITKPRGNYGGKKK